MTTKTEPLDASVTLEEIFDVVSQKRAPLAPELAGYLVLELGEGAANAGEIDPKYVYVSEEGSVALVRGPDDPTGDSEASLRSLLAKLLETAGAQTPALASVARRKGGAGVAVLVEELEAALIPVNRSAGKRALARLARETKRVTNRVGRNASIPDSQTDTKPPPPPVLEPIPPEAESQSDLPTVGISKEDLEAAQSRTKRDSVDSLLDSFEASGGLEERALQKELKAMAGLDPTLTPPPTKPRQSSLDDASAIESLLAESAPVSSADLKVSTGKESPVARRNSSNPPPKKEEKKESKPRDPAPSFADVRQMQTAPSQVKLQKVSISSEFGRKKSGSAVGIIVLLVFVLAGFALALWLVKPGFLTGRTPEKIAEERRAAEAESARIAAKAGIRPCHATVIVSGAPKDSEILIREGQAPVDVEHMPMGARLEFVATAEGYAPKRTIVPADAAWDSSSGKPRFDLPVQLDKSKAKPNTVDSWPPGEIGPEIGGKGTPGTIHVISAPKGAEIWLLGGIGPDANIEDIVSCDTDIDVLVAGPTTYRKRMHVPASSFTADPAAIGAGGAKAGVRVAHLIVK